MQPIHIGNPKKCIGHSSPLWLVGLKMKPYAISSDAEIARVRLGRIRWVGEHFLKSQDSAVIVFCSGRIRNRNDGNGARDHDIGSRSGFMWPTTVLPGAAPMAFKMKQNATGASSAARWAPGKVKPARTAKTIPAGKMKGCVFIAPWARLFSRTKKVKCHHTGLASSRMVSRRKTT